MIAEDAPRPLTDAEGQELLRLARRVIARAIGAAAPATSVSTTITAHSGAFVTLHVGDDLRGCIGYPASDRPLVEVVERCAISAATADPRFPAMTADEWSGVSLEVSVLGPIVPVTDASEVVVGRHGLVAEWRGRRGLLLPQVAVEHGWDREQFLARTCAKAGLPGDAWTQGASLFRFEAQVFRESPP
jgi:AmmeMemoRadiSam system protein A